MFGESAFGDLAFADLVQPAVLDVVSMLGTGLLGANPVTSLQVILTDPRAQMIFTAEIHPWVLASRA